MIALYLSGCSFRETTSTGGSVLLAGEVPACVRQSWASGFLPLYVL